jgi:hypothetical protein
VACAIERDASVIHGEEASFILEHQIWCMPDDEFLREQYAWLEEEASRRGIRP